MNSDLTLAVAVAIDLSQTDTKVSLKDYSCYYSYRSYQKIHSVSTPLQSWTKDYAARSMMYLTIERQKFGVVRGEVIAMERMREMVEV